MYNGLVYLDLTVFSQPILLLYNYISKEKIDFLPTSLVNYIREVV